MMTFGKIGTRKMIYKRKNPYVTNGLVAWWDGIWNVSIGIHDPNATVWKDLIGGLEFALPQGQYSITDKSIDMIRSNAVNRLDCYHDIVFGDMTLEAYMPSGAGNNYYTPNYQCDSRTITWGLSSVGALGTQIVGSTQTNYMFNPKVSSGAIAVCFKSDASRMDLFCNGQACSKSFSWSGSGTFVQRISLGLPEYLLPYYYFRVYNRNLTADEIMHNYVVDTARFNLP